VREAGLIAAVIGAFRRGRRLHDNVKTLEQGKWDSNFVRVEIEGFDEIMLGSGTELEKNLGMRARWVFQYIHRLARFNIGLT